MNDNWPNEDENGCPYLVLKHKECPFCESVGSLASSQSMEDGLWVGVCRACYSSWPAVESAGISLDLMNRTYVSEE